MDGKWPLDSIGPCFVHTVLGMNIRTNFIFCHGADSDIGLFGKCDRFYNRDGSSFFFAGEDGNSRINLVGVPLKERENVKSIFLIFGFAEDGVGAVNDGVCADDEKRVTAYDWL